MDNKQIYFFIGTTAEFIKLAPIMKELKSRGIRFKIITSGQNRVNFKDLENYCGILKADIAFTEKLHQSSMVHFFLWTIKTLFTSCVVLNQEFKGLNKDNSYFIIHGDTVSALIGSIIAIRYGLKLVHIESGLRSFNFFEPFPEEICRFIIIHLSDILFSPTQWAFDNLKNINGIKVNTHQNTLIEPCLWALQKKEVFGDRKKIGKYYILVMHRQEHIYFQKKWTQQTLNFVIDHTNKDLRCAFIMHTLTRRLMKPERFTSWINAKKRVITTPRLPYVKFIHFMKNAEFIATDGGINQEEAYYMGLPMLSLRNNTERMEGINENVVMSKDNRRIIKSFLKGYSQYIKPPTTFEVRPSKIIVDFLMK